MRNDVSAPGSDDHRLATTLFAGAVAVAGAAVALQLRGLRGVESQYRYAGMLLRMPTSKLLLPLVRNAIARIPLPRAPDGIEFEERFIAGPADRSIRIVIVRRRVRSERQPAVLWMHGGGYLVGRPEMELPLFFRLLEELDVTIVSVDYLLAPEHPFPAPLDDCQAALAWVGNNASTLGIDEERVAIGGVSAGGGLAAALVQRAIDAGTYPLCQLLIYPMLDDRTSRAPDDHGRRGRHVWTARANRRAWAAYLGDAIGAEDQPYAVPARRLSVSGLPPAWIGVGTLDLFYAEDVAYARALETAGVACQLDIVPRAYHGFDLMRMDAPGSRSFHDGLIGFLAARINAHRASSNS